MKQIGNFVYFYSEDYGNIIISNVATHSRSLSELTVKFQLLGKMFVVEGKHVNVEYHGFNYPGVVFYNNVTEEELIDALSESK